MKKPNKLPPVELLNELFDYDPCNGLLISKQTNREAGSFNTQLYRTVRIQNKQYYVHRVVYKMFYGKDPGVFLIDHINGCPHDNSIDNLRRCRNKTNLRNSKASRRDNTKKPST